MVKFLCPVENPILTSKYGMRLHPVLKVNRLHAGVDLISKNGSKVPILVTADGTVRLQKTTKDGYGKHLIITHLIDGKKYETVYAHLDSFKVKQGDKVKQGQEVGIMGNTGIGTGVHLHFEVHEGTYNYGSGTYPSSKDPLSYISLNDSKKEEKVEIDLTKITIADMSNNTLKNGAIDMVENALKQKIIKDEKWLKDAKAQTLSIADLIGLKIIIDNAKKK